MTDELVPPSAEGITTDTEPSDCTFCDIRDGRRAADMVLDEPDVVAFLDHRPLFLGHVLLIPRPHHTDIFTMPTGLVGPVFEAAQRVSAAVREAMDADGVFVASNNGVSQSVDHLHVHVVPRKQKDGLRGFMWPRHRYISAEESADVATRIRSKLRG